VVPTTIQGMTGFQPVMDIVSLVQCAVPGLFAWGHQGRYRGLPEMEWVKTNEGMLRDVMGWKLFVGLRDAVADVGRACMGD
jgi:hypothetical protein